MTLGLHTNSNTDFLPIVIYDARAGRMFKVERTQGAAGWESQRVDITTPPPTFAVDMGSICVGWVDFTASGPDFHVVPLGQPLPVQPSKKHRQCFKAKVAGKVLDGVREFSHAAKCVLASMDDLHTRFEAAPEAAQGKIPVVQLTGTVAVATKGPQGITTNYAPTFSIVSWTDRLPAFGERTVPAPTTKGNGHAAPPAAHVPPPGHVPPPVAAPAPAAAPDTMPF